MSKKKRKKDLAALWQGKVRKVIAQCSGPEVQVLLKLLWHKGMTSEQKYLVLDRAIFDVWSEREADREEEAKVRRKRAREQARQEKEFSEPTEVPSPNTFPQPSFSGREEPLDPQSPDETE